VLSNKGHFYRIHESATNRNMQVFFVEKSVRFLIISAAGKFSSTSFPTFSKNSISVIFRIEILVMSQHASQLRHDFIG